jgi:hypothetical protein
VYYLNFLELSECRKRPKGDWLDKFNQLFEQLQK